MQSTAKAATIGGWHRSAAGLAAASALALLALPQAGHAAFSNDKNNPTVLPWSEILSIAGAVSQPGGPSATVAGVSPNAQYVSFTVPIGYEFTSLKLVNYNSSDLKGFVALQAGDKWTAVPNTSTGALPGALAWHHFGNGGGARSTLCSQNYQQAITLAGVCLTDAAANSDLFARSIGGPIAGPLPAGPYTLWLQQTNTTPVGFTFQATSTAVPAPLPLLGLGAGFGVSRRLRRRIRGRGR
ncbi:MAG: hypothetical protein VKK43_11045 [Synechococcaceae cyanobacterium]|nr:hypothetical protein [Synechococcaceae cyanobacterium]